MDERAGWAVENFTNAYKQWLVDGMRADRYTILFDYLHDVQFHWDPDIPRDADREADGRWLRHDFATDSGMDLPGGALDWPASFLEVVIALARQVEGKIMYDPETDEDESDWFWEMIGNMGLGRCDNSWMLDSPGLAQAWVMERVEAVMSRRYSADGEGGMFPVPGSPVDQRTEEMWYQANDYFFYKYF